MKTGHAVSEDPTSICCFPDGPAAIVWCLCRRIKISLRMCSVSCNLLIPRLHGKKLHTDRICCDAKGHTCFMAASCESEPNHCCHQADCVVRFSRCKHSSLPLVKCEVPASRREGLGKWTRSYLEVSSFPHPFHGLSVTVPLSLSG